MRKHALGWGLGLALALGAGGVDAQERPQVDMWVEPLGMALSALAQVASPNDLLYAPFGLTWRARPGAQTWSVELAPYRLGMDESLERTYGARLSAGPVFGAGPGDSGAFVQPLGTVHLHHNTASATGVGLEVGVDLGHRFQFGHLSLTTLLGVGLGVGFGLSPGSERVASSFRIAEDGYGGGPILVYNVTLDLLRVGYTF